MTDNTPLKGYFHIQIVNDEHIIITTADGCRVELSREREGLQLEYLDRKTLLPSTNPKIVCDDHVAISGTLYDIDTLGYETRPSELDYTLTLRDLGLEWTLDPIKYYGNLYFEDEKALLRLKRTQEDEGVTIHLN